MRQVLSLSLPMQSTKEIKSLSKKRGFDTVSGYVKHLVEMDKDLISDEELMKCVRQGRKEYKEGKCIKANSLSEAIKIYDGK